MIFKSKVLFCHLFQKDLPSLINKLTIQLVCSMWSKTCDINVNIYNEQFITNFMQNDFSMKKGYEIFLMPILHTSYVGR